jgi:hypothetical protein
MTYMNDRPPLVAIVDVVWRTRSCQAPTAGGGGSEAEGTTPEAEGRAALGVILKAVRNGRLFL